MIVQTLTTHQRVTLGEPIARGGEATVYEVVGARDTLAKIYEKPRAGYDQKLIWMIANPPNINHGQHPSIAWPTELLYDNKHFVGYLMPRISGGAVKLLEVFNPRVRAKVMPKFNWRYLHRAARNLSAALALLHARDYVVGDLNESNILVMPTALITLIDTDSFQVRALMQNKAELYACPVARLEYTPPELQGHALNEPRKPEHDNFGLAVLIFQLLMDGSHPFRGRWLGAGDPPAIEERIRNGWFPYATNGKVAPLPTMLPFSALDPQVATLFTRCFVAGQREPSARPSAEEWRDTLDAAEQNLIECARHHLYAKHLHACPWCNLQRETLRVAPPSKRERAHARREERRARMRNAPVLRPVPAQSYAPYPTPPPFNAPMFPRGISMPTPRVSPTTVQGVLTGSRGAFRFSVAVVATLGSVLNSIARGIATPNLRVWWRGVVLVLSGAATGTLIWTIIGASAGALIGAGASVWDHLVVVNTLLLHARDGALLGGSVAVIVGLVFSLLSEAIARFKGTGGALVGVLLGGALGVYAPVTMSGTWQNFVALGMLLGGLFALASVPSINSPRLLRLSASSSATLTVMRRVNQQSLWLVLFSTALGTALLSALLWFLAWTSAPIAVVLGAGAGFIGGVVVAVSARQP